MTRRTWRSTALVVLTAAVVAGALAGCTPAPTTTGVTVPEKSISGPAVSADGRWVAFLAGSDLYLYDRSSGSSSLVVHGAGTPAISGDGRYLAFVSMLDLTGNGASHRDVFVWDRTTAEVTQLTHGNGDSGMSTYDESSPPVDISVDGRVLAFTTKATDIVPGGNRSGSLVALDRDTGVASVIASPMSGHADNPSLSGDGRFVSYTLHAIDEYRGTIHRLDRSTGEDLVLDPGYGSSISSDGKRVAYERFLGSGGSEAVVWTAEEGGLVPTKVVDPTTDGGYRGVPDISADGRTVAFMHQPSPTDAHPRFWPFDVFVWDLDTDALTRVTDGGDPSWSGYPTISSDGRTVAFVTTSDLVVPGARTQAALGIWHRP
jgi:Tol biopolymer transport system component